MVNNTGSIEPLWFEGETIPQSLLDIMASNISEADPDDDMYDDVYDQSDNEIDNDDDDYDVDEQYSS